MWVGVRGWWLVVPPRQGHGSSGGGGYVLVVPPCMTVLIVRGGIPVSLVVRVVGGLRGSVVSCW